VIVHRFDEDTSLATRGIISRLRTNDESSLEPKLGNGEAKLFHEHPHHLVGLGVDLDGGYVVQGRGLQADNH
jgi:hypothetical protein